MADKQLFLEKLRNKLELNNTDVSTHPYKPINNLPYETLSGKTQEELLEVAKARVEKINAQIVETTSGTLEQTLKELIQGFGGGNVLLPSDDRIEQYGLQSLIGIVDEETEIHQWKQGVGYRDENIAQAQNSNVAIAFAEMLLAESGSVVVENHAGQGRCLHFLPTHYISIVPMSRIVPRTTQFADFYQEKLLHEERIGSDVNIISGPSNSGDIEMVLVTGLHGPIEVKYVVVKDR